MADDLRWLGLDWSAGWPEDKRFAQGSRGGAVRRGLLRARGKGAHIPLLVAPGRSASPPPRPIRARSTRAAAPCRGLEGLELARRECGKRPPAYKCAVPDEDVTIIDGHLGEYAQNLAKDGGGFHRAPLGRSLGLSAGRERVTICSWASRGSCARPGPPGERAAPELAHKDPRRPGAGIRPRAAPDRAGRAQALQARRRPQYGRAAPGAIRPRGAHGPPSPISAGSSTA